MSDSTFTSRRIYGNAGPLLALLGIASLFSSASLYGQGYQQTYGLPATNERPALHPVESTADDGAIMAGTTEDAYGNRDVYLIKTSSSGAVQWANAYGSSAAGSHEYAYDVLEERDDLGATSGYVVVGGVSDANGDDIFMLKVDKNGGYQWSYRYKEPGFDAVGYAIVRHNSEYLIASVRYHQNYPAAGDPMALKTDLNGNSAQIMHITNTPNIDDGVYDITITQGGGAVMAGYTTNGPARDGLIFSFDPATGALASLPRRYGSAGDDEVFHTVHASGANCLVAGTVDDRAGATSIWGLAADATTLSPVWGNTYSATVAGPGANKVNLGADMRLVGSNYALVGTTAYRPDNSTTAYTNQIVLAALNTATGLPLAASAYGGSSPYGRISRAYGVRATHGGNGHLIGGEQNFQPLSIPSTGADAYLIRANAGLATGCLEQRADLSATPYADNSSISLVSDGFKPISSIPHGTKLEFGIGAYEFCYCPSPLCKQAAGHLPASSGELSLEVHGNPATGDLHIAVAGIREGTSIDIFDAAGRMVRSFQSASGIIVWDGTGDAGNRLPSGLYFVRAQGATSVITRPAQLVR